MHTGAPNGIFTLKKFIKKTNISHLGHEQNSWLRSLDFYKEEMAHLRIRLTEIAGRNTSKEAALGTEQFENKLKIHVDNLDRLKHEIHEHMQRVSSAAQANSAGFIDDILVKQYDEFSDAFKAIEQRINDLRHDFNRFSAIWM